LLVMSLDDNRRSNSIQVGVSTCLFALSIG
jgi:hypothetical protein